MNSIHHGWSLDEIAPEARRAAERAAEAAGMPLETWLNQLIKYVSAMELSGKGPARARAIDETIKRAAAEQARIGPVDGPEDGRDEAPMMLENEVPHELPTTLPAEALEPNRFAEEQPGERDIEQAIGEWRKSGALKPLVVRPDSRKPGRYEIVSGMARWHAASRLHMRRIPVTVLQLSDEEVLRATLIQKLHTKTLPPLDEAQIYQRLMEETGLSVAALSDVIGRSPTHVATALQLLDLPEPVREMINSGEISVLHARTLLGAADPEPVAREVVARRLDIYQTEQLVRASHGALSHHARARAETAPAAKPVEPAAERPAPEEAAAPEPEVQTAEAPVEPEPVPEASAAPEFVAPSPKAPEPAPPPPPAVAPAAEAAPPTETSGPSLDAGTTLASESGQQPAEVGEPPLDMGQYITADMGPRSEPRDSIDTISPVVLGSGQGSAGTLIEASPAIDRPTADDVMEPAPAFAAPSTDRPAEHKEAEHKEGASAAAEAPEIKPVNAQPVASLSSPAADETRAVEVSPAPAASGNSGHAGNHQERGEAGEARHDDSTRMVENHLTTLLGLKVSIAERNQDDGVLSIHYNSESELTDLVSRLNRMPTGRRTD